MAILRDPDACFSSYLVMASKQQIWASSGVRDVFSQSLDPAAKIGMVAPVAHKTEGTAVPDEPRSAASDGGRHQREPREPDGAV